jgi:hypothetical protein
MARANVNLMLAVLAAAAAITNAYPSLWARRTAPSCSVLPAKGYACHKAPVADK